MGKRTCTFKGCDHPHSGHGYCGGHLAQVRRGVELSPLRSNGRGGGKCSECGESAIARGWCSVHHWRWLKYGDPLGSAPPRPDKPDKCGFPGCTAPYGYSGYCAQHARQKARGVELHPLPGSRRYSLNESFFDEVDTEEKAYWLGFITADGCVVNRKAVTINLSDVDSGHLEKLSTSLSSDIPVRHLAAPPPRRPDGRFRTGPIARWDAVSVHMVSSLVALGVTPRKSKTVIPWHGPAHLMLHYWRGMVDGDGGMSLFRCRPTAPKEQWRIYLAGSQRCVEEFGQWASGMCGSRAKSRRTQRTGGCWYWAVGGNTMVRTVVAELYGDCSISLDRKQALADVILGR